MVSPKGAAFAYDESGDSLTHLQKSLQHALPKLPSSGQPATARTRRGSSTRTISFSPALPSIGSADFIISCSRRVLTSAAVSFPPCGLISSQYRDNADIPTVVMRLSQLDPTVPESALEAAAPRAVWSTLFCYVASGAAAPAELEIELPLPSQVLHHALLALGAVVLHPTYRISRAALFEQFAFAHSATVPLPFPYLPSKTNDVEHPHRPPKPTGTLYSRHVPHLEEYFKLDVAQVAKQDIDTLHAWLNDPRVDEWWGDKGTWEAHEKFLQGRTDDPHVLPVIGSYVPVRSIGVAGDDNVQAIEERAVYSEIYWVKEDPLGTLMAKEGQDAKDYDRGLHVLVGSNAHRGEARVRAWLPSLVHYCFMDDPRTERVVAEPNEKNTKMLKYFESVGFVRHGSVTFPHKVSALMICERRAFFQLCPF